MTFTGLGLVQLLALGGAVTVGVVLLYVLKLRRRRVEVPFVVLWEELTEEHFTTSLLRRLRRWLSLLIQLAIAGAMVFALGDPRPTSPGGGCGYTALAPRSPRHLVLALDTSASMGALEAGETRLERGAREAHRLVDALSRDPSQRLMVVSSDVSVRTHTLWTTDPQVAHGAIDEILARGPADAATSVENLLDHLRQTLVGREGARVVWITDGAFEAPGPEALGEIPLHLSVVGTGSGNVGIEALNVRPHLDDSLRYAVFCAVRNETDHPLDATILLYANEQGLSPQDFVTHSQIVSSFPLHLPPRQVTRHLLEDVTFSGSRLAARVVLDPASPVPDRLARDDVAVALVPPRRNLRVQLVSDENLFVQAALLLRKNLQVKVIPPEAYEGPEGYDLTILDRVDVDLSAPGDYLLFQPPSSPTFDAQATVREPRVQRVDRSHPVGRGLSLVDLGIEEATRYAGRRGDRVVVQGPGGLPLVFQREDRDKGQRFVVVAFDVRKSLLPLRYAFPLLIVNILDALHPQPMGLLTTHGAGAPLSLETTLPPGPLQIRGPQGAKARARWMAGRVLLESDRAGVYEISSVGADAPMLVALNLMDPQEVNIDPRGSHPTWSPPPVTSQEDVPWPGVPWRALLVLALVGVVVEWWTWNRGWTL